MATDALASERVIAKMLHTRQSRLRHSVAESEGTYGTRALLQSQPISLSALSECSVTLVDRAWDLALLQGESKGKAADATADYSHAR